MQLERPELRPGVEERARVDRRPARPPGAARRAGAGAALASASRPRIVPASTCEPTRSGDELELARPEPEGAGEVGQQRRRRVGRRDGPCATARRSRPPAASAARAPPAPGSRSRRGLTVAFSSRSAGVNMLGLAVKLDARLRVTRRAPRASATRSGPGPTAARRRARGSPGGRPAACRRSRRRSGAGRARARRERGRQDLRAGRALGRRVPGRHRGQVAVGEDVAEARCAAARSGRAAWLWPIATIVPSWTATTAACGSAKIVGRPGPPAPARRRPRRRRWAPAPVPVAPVAAGGDRASARAVPAAERRPVARVVGELDREVALGQLGDRLDQRASARRSGARRAAAPTGRRSTSGCRRRSRRAGCACRLRPRGSARRRRSRRPRCRGRGRRCALASTP